MCRRHYRRAARGLDLDPDDGHQVGLTPSGHGRWGVVDVDADGRLLCHECGRWLTALGVHVGMVHDGGVRAYRLRHGLTMSTRLAAEPLRQTLAEHATRGGYGDRLAASRQPDRARQSADPEVTARGARLTGLLARTRRDCFPDTNAGS